MFRRLRKDAALEELTRERDDINVQISLLNEADCPDAKRMAALHWEMVDVQERIRKQRPHHA